MAHKEPFNESNNAGLTLLYNVDRAVGAGAFNLRDDVQLVQFFLVKFFRRNPEERPWGVAPLYIDGFYGPITARHIKTFQDYTRNMGYSIYSDGRVDPANPSGVSTISHTVYTILHLNSGFKFSDPDQGYFDHLEDHPEIIAFAPELRAALLASQ
jgi:hypothetical protein